MVFNQPPGVRFAGDVVSGLAVMGVFAHMLPVFVSILAAVWYLVNLYESRPVQTYIRLRRHRSRRRKLGRSIHGARVHYRRPRRKQEPAEV